MIKTLIIEDEPQARDGLKKILSLIAPDIEVIGETASIKESLLFLKNNTIDLAFLDIELDDGHSFDLLKKLKKINFKVIFTTAFNDYAIKAFKFNALDYLLKPIDPSELQAAIQKATKEIKQDLHFDSLLRLSKTKEEQKITLKTSDNTYVVEVANIIRLEAEGAYTKFITTSNNILISKNLRYYEDLLSSYKFIRTHQSHLVNYRHILSIAKQQEVYLSKDERVPISTRRKKEVFEAIGRFEK